MTPIEKAVAPLKRIAVLRAVRMAINDVHRIKRDLEAHDWNIAKAVPCDWRKMSEREYRDASRKRNHYYAVASHINSYKYEDRDTFEMSPEKIRHYIEMTAESAAASYDAFVMKMVHKVGEHSKATLEGNHVWGRSILTVTTPHGIEKWKTQCIDNRSKLGLWFNQWPSRKVK